MITLETPKGTTVRLVDASNWLIPDAAVKMNEGDIFTIREVTDEFSELAIALEERRDMTDPALEPWFAARRFELVKCVLDDMPETTRLCDLSEAEYAHFDRGLSHYSGCTLSRPEEGGPEGFWQLYGVESCELLTAFSDENTIGEVWKRAEELSA